MLAKPKLQEIDPQEDSPRQGDFVSIGRYEQRWRINTIQGATLYLRSEIGGRFATAPAGRVIMIWRDPNYDRGIDWRSFYSQEGNYDWPADDE